MEIAFEKLEMKHGKEVVEILNYYIENTTSAYREKAVDEDFSLKFLESSDIHCSFVMKNIENKVIGFCTLEPHIAISVFSKVAEVMYFIHHEHTGNGIGSLALKKLEEEARKRGIQKLLADTSDENIGSMSFHRKNGFVEYGRLTDIGEKFGRKFGVVYLVKDLN